MEHLSEVILFAAWLQAITMAGCLPPEASNKGGFQGTVTVLCLAAYGLLQWAKP